MKSYHFVATANENRYGARVLAFLDDQHSILCRTECQFPDYTGMTKFLRRQLLEAWHDASTGRDGNQLEDILSLHEYLVCKKNNFIKRYHLSSDLIIFESLEPPR